MKKRMVSVSPNPQLRYAVGDHPPWPVSVLLSVQTVLLIVAGIILTPAIVLRGAGMDAGLEPQVIFFALLVSGVVTVLQARPAGRFGAGYILLMGTSGAFIAAAISALQYGGLPLLMALIVFSSSLQFVLAARLSLFRRIVTPLVGGITIMLLAVTVMPVAFAQLDVDSPGAPWVALVTILPVMILTFFGQGGLKLWAPIIGIVLGCALHGLLGGEFNLVLPERVADGLTTPVWFGLPELSWPGLDLSFGPHFWMLLPMFFVVTIVGALETYGDAIAIQKTSQVEDKATDYRVVQGALNADGMGNLLAGLVGTLPCTTYSTSISVVDITGVASRQVGLICGLILVGLSFAPLFYGLILAIPDAVVGAYLCILIAMLFVHGLRLISAEPITTQRGMIITLSFWAGIGFQQGAIFKSHIPDWMSPITDNGMTVGTALALVLMLIYNLKTGGKRVFCTTFDPQAVAGLHEFIESYANRYKWPAEQSRRVQLAAEETLLCLLDCRQRDPGQAGELRAEIRSSSEGLTLDIAVGADGENIQDLMIQAAENGHQSMGHLPYRVLDAITDDVRHLQFNNLDYVCLKLT